MRRLLIAMFTFRLLALVAMLLGAAGVRAADSVGTSMRLLPDEPIRPLPEKIEFNAAKAALGKRLFFDTRFSRDNKVSCANCHDFAKGGADGRARPVGVDGRVGMINVPTVFNSGFNFRQLWNGKAETLEHQIDLVITNPNVFDTSWTSVLAKLSLDAELVRDFKNVYLGGLSRESAMDALAEFERSLVTPSRFDAYLRGDANAISAEEKQGYARFKSYGCIACHQGINVGGNMFQVFGVVRPYLKPDDADFGRYLVTGRDSDKFVFKVPSLRNVARTAPYFHNASAASLEEAVDVMFKYQLGRSAPRADKTLIVKFLNSLSGQVPSHALAEK